MTMVVAYDTVFDPETGQALKGHAILGSWEVGSKSAYLMVLSRHLRSRENPQLTPEIRTKIEKAFRQIGITQVTYDRDGLGIGPIKQYGDTCAATCLMMAMCLGCGLKTLPRFGPKDERTFVRMVACKLLQLSECA